MFCLGTIFSPCKWFLHARFPLYACQADLLPTCEAFCSADARISAVRQRALLALAVAFLQHFVRANWTGPREQAARKKVHQRQKKLQGPSFGVEKKQRKIMIFLWLQGLMSLKTYRFTVKSWLKKLASAGKIRSIKSHQSHEPFGDWKHTLGLSCTSSTMKWLEEDDATLPFHPSALAEASQGEDVRNLDLKS